MNKLFFGGSFNPVANHHLLLAQLAAEAAGYDHVVLIPCCEPPHKSTTISFEHRYTMCQLAVQDLKVSFSVSNIEQVLYERTGRKSFTIDTVLALKAMGNQEVALLIGSDSLRQLGLWHQSKQLLQEARFVVAPRGDKSDGFFPNLHLLGYERHLCIHDLPVINVSSTFIRERVARYLSNRFLVPQSVEEYISENGLYME